MIVEQHHLITTGIYQYMRHPCYSGLILVELGLTITASFHTTVLIFMGAGILAVGYRIWHEERLLREFFKDEYTLYADKVKRLIPFIY